MKVSTVQSSFASSNRITESNDNLAAALQGQNDWQERERASIAGSKILTERKKHQTREEYATERVIMAEGLVLCFNK